MARQSKQISNPEIEAANEIYKVAREQADQEMARLREEMEGLCFEAEATGILRKIEYDLKHNELIKYSVLCRVKQNKEYRKSGKSWEEFCVVIGEDRRNVDRIIEDLRPVVDAFSDKLSGLIGVPFNKIRYLGRTIPDKLSGFEDGALIIDGAKIPLTPEHKDEIEAAIDAMKESHEKEVEEKDADLQASKKVLKDKEKVINGLAKDLAKAEGKAEKAGYTPGEEAFLQKMSTALLTLDGFLMDFDPERNPLPEDATARMKASFMETLGYFKRVTDAAFDTGADLYGDPEMDDDWVPPHKRDPKEMTPEMRKALGIQDTPSECVKCEFHKGMASKFKGVKIPGGYGKCTRPEGHCNPSIPSD